MPGMGRRIQSRSSHVAVGVFVGVVCGFFLGSWSRDLLAACSVAGGSGNSWENGAGCCGGGSDGRPGRRGDDHRSRHEDGGRVGQQPGAQASEAQERNPDNFLFVGIMTAKKYLSSRVVAAYRTWASSIPGRVMFFCSEGSELADHPDIPIVALPGVDDTYPPQKKSMLMFKYMHDRFGDKFEWFMRADDDVYIKGDRLALMLRSVNSSVPQFIGQAGTGTADEIGLLSLEENENFCMGGPGIVMSRTTLQRFVPHIGYCLKNLYTTHEDVEIGRCVRKFAGVSCTWAFEMQQLFYQNHLDYKGSFNHSLKMKEVRMAITMHPFKNHTFQYRMHQHLMGAHTADLRNKLVKLQREINVLNVLLNDRPDEPASRVGQAPFLNKFHPRLRKDVLPWEFIKGRSLYSDGSLNPKKGLDTAHRLALDDLVMQLMTMINKSARQRGRTIDFKEILYGYKRVNPLHGADYIFDLLLIYRKHKGRRMTMPVRRHAYLQQTFMDIEFREEFLPLLPKAAPSTTTSSHFLLQLMPRFSHHFYNAGNKGAVQPAEPVHDVNVILNKTIHFIMPLAGRYQTFLAFMRNFEDVCLRTQSRSALAVMLFHSETDDRTEETIAYIGELQIKYPNHDLKVIKVKGPFSRALALQQGSALYDRDALMFFIDVDIYLNTDSLYRIRTLIIQHSQVYFPIVFSQYDPKMLCPSGEEKCSLEGSTDPFSFKHDYGYWRRFGFGIAGIYKSDFEKIGGFDTTIMGWGKEDVDLFNRILSSNLSIYRAVDPGIVHIFHPINCDPSLDPAQYQMCLGTKVATYGSITRLAALARKTEEIVHRDNGVAEGAKDEGRGQEGHQFLVADA